MKRFFIAIAMLSAFIGTKADEFDYPTLTDNTSYVGKYAPVNTPVAYGTDGTVYATGLYDDMVVIGSDILEPVATSAYLSAVDPTSKAVKWTIGIKGAARITAITAESDAIYIAGIFADDITLGSKDANTKDYTGTSLSHDKVNGFVAKYSLDGNLLASQSIIPHKIAAYGDYDSDLMVNPTAITVFDNNVYMSMTFCGGYNIDTFTKDGNVKQSFGYWNSKCVEVLSLSKSDLSCTECIYDIRNSNEVNTNGYAPSSVCVTSDADRLYIGAFTSHGCTEKVLVMGQTYPVSGSSTTYYFIISTIDKIGNFSASAYSSTSDRYYVNNVVKKMTVSGGKLYLTGCASTPLPFMSSVEPDLWTDQFVACINMNIGCTEWAHITGAKRDDMATSNDKYREATDGVLVDGKYIAIGTTNFVCDAQGNATDYSSDYCLGIADNGSSLALVTKTDNGSKLSVNAHDTGIESVTADEMTDGTMYDVAGRKIKNPVKGSLYIQSKKTYIAK